MRWSSIVKEKASDRGKSLSEAIFISCYKNLDTQIKQIIQTLLQVRECSDYFHVVEMTGFWTSARDKTSKNRSFCTAARYGKRKRLRGSSSVIFKEIKATRTSSDCLYLVEMTGFEPATSTSRRVTHLIFKWFLRLFGAFQSEIDAFRCSRSHCFHTVQVRRWSKVWSTRNSIQETKPRL